MLFRVTMLAPLTPKPTDSKELIFLMVFSRTLVSYIPTLAERRGEGERERGREGERERGREEKRKRKEERKKRKREGKRNKEKERERERGCLRYILI